MENTLPPRQTSARAASLAATDGLHRSRALERVTTPGDPDRPHVEEALKCYLPRAVYALITIINKLDGFSPTSEHRNALFALVLTACDEANVLWPHPAERPRPKQLTIPTRFLEKNIWLALERGVESWSGGGQPVEAVSWPKDPGEAGGLCLFNGPMRDLAPRLKDVPLKTVVTVLPRPNQAFWTLSALWAGWLWGREAAAPFKSALHRLRYDWNWHAEALYAALKNLSDRLTLNAPLFAIIPEPEPAFLSAALLAAAESGFDLAGQAVRTRHDPVQVLWQRRAFSLAEKEPVEIDAEAVRQAMVSALKERGEPVPILHLHAAGAGSNGRRPYPALEDRGAGADQRTHPGCPGESGIRPPWREQKPGDGIVGAGRMGPCNRITARPGGNIRCPVFK